MLTDMLPQGDILIHLGDFCNKGSIQDAEQFVDWISNLNQYQEKFVIDGNHDRTLIQKNCHKVLTKSIDSKNNDYVMDLETIFAQVDHVQLLQDEFIETIDGLNIYGASWKSCERGSIPQHFSRNGHTIRPDILLAHSPPYLSRSITIPQVGEGRSKGWRMNKELSRTVVKNRVPLSLSGHVHWCRGKVEINQDYSGVNEMSIDRSIFLNAASLQSQNRGNPYVAPPFIIDFDLRRRIPMCIFEHQPQSS